MIKQNRVDNLAKFIAKKYKLFAPIKQGKRKIVKEVENIKKIDYSAQIPENSYKNLFLPKSEEIFSFKNNKLIKSKTKVEKKAAWGMGVFDLKALGLFDLVFSKDKYYQRRRESNIVVGLSVGAPSDYAEYKVFSMDKEENVLEHIPFDVFLQKNNNGEYHIYSGSVKGRRILKEAGIDIFENIQFTGLIQEEGLDKKMLEMQRRVSNSQAEKIWQEIGDICTACGKCTMVCPTCFCFKNEDIVKDEKNIIKERQTSDCFSEDFSCIAGNIDFLPTNKDKIFFWYEHKFCRIPNEYKVPGCVSCMRCYHACPVGINIVQVLNKLKKK